MSDGGSDWPADPLAERAERTPDRLALLDADADDRWTFREFDAFVDSIARGLRAADVAAGDTVATVLGTRPLTAALPFATTRLGATLAPLNVDLDPDTVIDQLDRLTPALLLQSTETAELTRRWDGGAVETIDGPTDSTAERFEFPVEATGSTTRDQDAPSESGSATGAPIAPDETALVVFTSGTTGRPKGVRLSMANLLSSATASAYRLGVSPRDRWFSPLSTYHVGGIAPYVRGVLYGTAVVLQREFDADRTATALAATGATCASFVPTMLRRVLDAGWRPGPDFRFVLLGGGPASEELLDRCSALDVRVCPTYGATETASQVATATPGEARTYRGTVGRPLYSAHVRIVADRSVCEPGDVGELVVDGPMVTAGYLDPDATAEHFEDGRFHTGDLGYRDEAGRLWIVGRADDVIVTGGENVRPAVVADALTDHDAVADAAVVGVPDDEWGERVVALVVTSEGDNAKRVSPAGLREFCRGKIPEFAIPKSITFAEGLPRTPSGTIDRGAVRERFQ